MTTKYPLIEIFHINFILQIGINPRESKVRFLVKYHFDESLIPQRQKEFLNKARELNSLCGVELTVVIYSPYHEEPKVFPSHEATTNTFTNFKKLSELVQ
uniref:MADS-box domain-containing protein n=1 Tax=Solanum lycopersicum TaxID=4081 RepID=A0A3Q7EHG5_SOLLC